jgi:putative DNA primase/helicase
VSDHGLLIFNVELTHTAASRCDVEESSSRQLQRRRLMSNELLNDSCANDNFNSWEDQLQQTKTGIKASSFNVHLILSNHEHWKGKISYDEFAERTQLGDKEWTDVDTTECQRWISENYCLEIRTGQLDAIIEAIAHEHSFHPVRQYFRSLVWDGKERLPSMLHEIFKTEDNMYYSAIGTMWMISAVARVMRPGCQADSALVLISPEQGRRKSTAFRVLGMQWTADSTIDIGSKDAMQTLRGVLIYELAELSSIRSARDVETVKNFISSRSDRYRPSYGKRAANYPRQIVFGGSTNNAQCLHDVENRRFWTADVGMIDIERLENEVDQLWAEAFHRFNAGEQWWPNEDVAALIKEEGLTHTEVDPWLAIVEAYLDHYNMDSGITTEQLLTKVIRIDAKDLTKQHEMRMGVVLRQLGLTRRRIMVGGERLWRYVR